jgi:hypothetical protein
MLEESLESSGVGVDLSSSWKCGGNLGEINRFDLKQANDEAREALNT